MEIRTLRYFFETAREGNITRAAQRLHVSQPTMSKQLKALEDILGTKLFIRSNYSIKLTEAGMLLKERAEDILALVDKTLMEFNSLDSISKGDIFVGAAESITIRHFTAVVQELQAEHRHICCHMYSGNVEDVCYKLDRGLLDFALVTALIDITKYNMLKLPTGDTWGVVMLKTSPLADKTEITLSDLIGLPLICSSQWVEHDLPLWLGDSGQLNIVATYNLAYNAFMMALSGMGYVITYDHLSDNSENSLLTFRPLIDAPHADMYLIWRKKQVLTPLNQLLLDRIKIAFKGDV